DGLAVPAYSRRLRALRLSTGSPGFTVLPMDEISPQEAAGKLREGARLVDVREKSERDSLWIPESVHVPLGELERRFDEVGPPGSPVIFHCAAGGRSLTALRMWK